LHTALTDTPLQLRSRGFTLIEVIIVMVIAAILIAVGVPQMTEFVAEQRVRTAVSDIAAEIAFARATAIETSRRVYIEKTGALWNNGWRIYADLNNNGSYDAGEEVKIFNGFSSGPAGRMYVCSNVADFSTTVIFRPDGRVVRTSAATADDGIYVVDTMGDANNCNNKIRGLLFGVSGRAKVEVIKSASSSCPGVAPPC
jgi:prepilin-type N-terminal cleavage/methylation domain-containing protein